MTHNTLSAPPGLFKRKDQVHHLLVDTVGHHETIIIHVIFVHISVVFFHQAYMAYQLLARIKNNIWKGRPVLPTL